MPDTRDDFAIRHVASLARLRLTAEEETLYARQLGDILAYATQLLRFDTTPPSAAALGGEAAAALRADLTVPSLGRDAVLASAPCQTDDGLFRVPRVIG
jgi:aspartyl-tRNA(Asn)/glutamyl-tRNA(Gln) amidotransferase subunit C